MSINYLSTIRQLPISRCNAVRFVVSISLVSIIRSGDRSDIRVIVVLEARVPPLPIPVDLFVDDILVGSRIIAQTERFHFIDVIFNGLCGCVIQRNATVSVKWQRAACFPAMTQGRRTFHEHTWSRFVLCELDLRAHHQEYALGRVVDAGLANYFHSSDVKSRWSLR